MLLYIDKTQRVLVIAKFDFDFLLGFENNHVFLILIIESYFQFLVFHVSYYSKLTSLFLIFIIIIVIIRDFFGVDITHRNA